MWPGFKYRCRCHMWVEFVVGSLLCSERFFSGYTGFPLSSKTNIPNFASIRNQVDEEPLCGCATSEPLLLLLLLLLLNPGLRGEKCPFPLNRGVPSIEVIDTKIMRVFFHDQILCPLNGGVPKERLHCVWVQDPGCLPCKQTTQVEILCLNIKQ